MSKRLVPSMTALQCFEAAARHLSFTRAAEELHLTQSAVSKQVAQLEDWTDPLQGGEVEISSGDSFHIALASHMPLRSPVGFIKKATAKDYSGAFIVIPEMYCIDVFLTVNGEEQVHVFLYK